MDRTQNRIDELKSQIETVEKCLNNLRVLEAGDDVYSFILKALRLLDNRLEVEAGRLEEIRMIREGKRTLEIKRKEQKETS